MRTDYVLVRRGQAILGNDARGRWNHRDVRMINEKLLALLKALQRGTGLGHVPWQDLPEDEMFLAQIGPGIVRLGKLSIGDVKRYTLWVFGVGGVIVAELEISEGDPTFPLIEDVYVSARLWVRDGEQLIDRMITQLTLA